MCCLHAGAHLCKWTSKKKTCTCTVKWDRRTTSVPMFVQLHAWCRMRKESLKVMCIVWNCQYFEGINFLRLKLASLSVWTWCATDFVCLNPQNNQTQLHQLIVNYDLKCWESSLPSNVWLIRGLFGACWVLDTYPMRCTWRSTVSHILAQGVAKQPLVYSSSWSVIRITDLWKHGNITDHSSARDCLCG